MNRAFGEEEAQSDSISIVYPPSKVNRLLSKSRETRLAKIFRRNSRRAEIEPLNELVTSHQPTTFCQLLLETLPCGCSISHKFLFIHYDFTISPLSTGVGELCKSVKTVRAHSLPYDVSFPKKFL